MTNYILILSLFIALASCKNDKKNTSENIKIGTTESTKKTQQTPLEESMERGGMVYTDFCMQCHLANGQGIPGNFPPLANSSWLRDKRTESIRAVKYGQKGKIVVNGKTYDGIMVPMGLSDQEVADVMNYVMNRWGNSQDKMVTEEEVAKVEKE
ncbi:c-type cytochrome [Luteirhabdus pelagi]|uniref:c-type cytochrome n=1 Tax=Luteirhabdus pelagi TaxID=2792783 RepID=UPI00193A5F7C|nr:cytochrome c [Luteirhabdus pelagi]